MSQLPKRRIILGLLNNKKKQFSYGLLNMFFALLIILGVNTVYLYKFSQSDICSDINPTRLINQLNLMTVGSILTAVLSGGLCFMFAIVLMHRFFGPMVQISRHIEELIQGNFKNRVHLRKKDELHELAEQLNQLTEELEKNYVRK